MEQIIKSKEITTQKMQAILTNDYSTGKYTYESLAKKHHTTRDVVYRYCNGIDKLALKKEINAIEKQLNKDEMLREMYRQGIDFQYIIKTL